MFLRFRCFRYSRVSTWSKFHEKHSFRQTPFEQTFETDVRTKVKKLTSLYYALWRQHGRSYHLVTSSTIRFEERNFPLKFHTTVSSLLSRRFFRNKKCFLAALSAAQRENLSGRKTFPRDVATFGRSPTVADYQPDGFSIRLGTRRYLIDKLTRKWSHCRRKGQRAAAICRSQVKHAGCAGGSDNG